MTITVACTSTSTGTSTIVPAIGTGMFGRSDWSGVTPGPLPYNIIDGANTEEGYGLWNGTTLLRIVILHSTSQGNPINLSGNNELLILPYYSAPPSTLPATLLSTVNYTTSQTITIPATAYLAQITMYGGSGGTGASAGENASGGSGGPGAVLKQLFCTPGNTLIFTVGAAGAAGVVGVSSGNATAGTNSTLVGGTQSMPTLTANGSAGTLGVAFNGSGGAGGVGGNASGGDTNILGGTGGNGIGGSGWVAGVAGLTINPITLATIATGEPGIGITSSSGANGFNGVIGKLTISWYTFT